MNEKESTKATERGKRRGTEVTGSTLRKDVGENH